MHNVLLVVIERKAAMGQSEHAVAVGIEAGEQGSPAGGASGRCAEGLSENYAFLRESLQVWGRH
jgi:hypothetical protein